MGHKQQLMLRPLHHRQDKEQDAPWRRSSNAMRKKLPEAESDAAEKGVSANTDDNDTPLQKSYKTIAPKLQRHGEDHVEEVAI